MAQREFDLILWGATGFTGGLVAEHLYTNYGCDGELSWAIAGRNPEKLDAVAQRLAGASHRAPPQVIADGDDPETIRAMVGRAKVVCSTVGPYERFGTSLVAACADSGTHYCDLTGEVPWMVKTIRDFNDRAATSGARIVHSCGFDSIPSDMGTWYVQGEMLKRHGIPAARVRGRIGRTHGSMSGGTVASLIGVMEAAGRDSAVRKQLADPYALNPPDAPRGLDRNDALIPQYDSRFQSWTAPFVMAVINTRVVRRSNALLGFPWGEDFRYDESQLCSSRLKALGLSAALGTGMACMSVAPTRQLARRLLPEPGAGPDAKARAAGHYEVFLHAEHPSDPSRDLRARVSGQLDPGYGSTSKMLGEAAVCLAKDDPAVGGGIWTPAAALGELLLARLQANAGLTFALV